MIPQEYQNDMIYDKNYPACSKVWKTRYIKTWKDQAGLCSQLKINKGCLNSCVRCPYVFQQNSPKNIPGPKINPPKFPMLNLSALKNFRMDCTLFIFAELCNQDVQVLPPTTPGALPQIYRLF